MRAASGGSGAVPIVVASVLDGKEEEEEEEEDDDEDGGREEAEKGDIAVGGSLFRGSDPGKGVAGIGNGEGPAAISVSGQDTGDILSSFLTYADSGTGESHVDGA